MLLVPPSTHRKGKPDPRLADLQRMRAIATLLLVLMTTIFIVTTATKHDWFWLPYVRAFSEAGMVGACADWFAVVALFRHPLGLPIPHTAIVPNNKERIGPALGRFITHNFLSTKVAHERLAKIDMVWLDHGLARRSCQYVASCSRYQAGVAADPQDHSGSRAP